MKLKTAAVLIFAVAAGSGLSACGSDRNARSGGGDPYAGVDAEIRSWRTSIEAENPLCADKVDGRGCEAFEVACKGEREVSAQERQDGVTARMAAAMIFQGRQPDGSTSRPGSAFATFTRADGAWVRTDSEPLNLQSCAPF